MTDNEIIKALECCLSGKDYDTACMKCPIEPICESDDILLKYALDLINRQKAIIEKSEKVEHFADKTIETTNAEIEKLENELYRAKVEISKHYDYMDKAANKAIDVFANSLKIKLNRMIDNLVKEMKE